MSGTGMTRRISTGLILVLLLFLALSCAEEKETEKEKPAETKEETIAFVDEEVSYGLYFDEEGTKRTIRLEKGQDQFLGYFYLNCPDYLEIAATQFRLVMPEGVVIEIDKYRMDRIMSLGTFQRGISERYAQCLNGPKVLLHTFTFRVTAPLDNAVFTILSSMDEQFLAVTECREGYPIIRASAFKAVINPSD